MKKWRPGYPEGHEFPKGHQWVTGIWYKDSFISRCLLPLSVIYSGIVRFRRFLYGLGLLKKYRMPVPVIVVGNITVGGTGKTPLIIWLAGFLKERGYRPGIISRGYGGQSDTWPQRVDASSDADRVGDEALLIAQKTGCPMAVAPLRVDAGRVLLNETDCDIILSDDGLQHYALDRDMEIAVIDGERRLGNGRCLPAGPLREPAGRLKQVDFIVVNGNKSEAHEFSMQLEGNVAVNLVTGRQKPLQEFAALECHALAGIGNPARFFGQLDAAGLRCLAHAFPDHYRFQRQDIEFDDDKPVLMTEKDAVKCIGFAADRHWSLPVKAVPEPGFAAQLLNLLREKHDR